LDTSVLIELDKLDADMLPRELAISAITLAELAAGPHATSDADERARRQERLQRAEATFEPLPFDAAAARAYGRVYAVVSAAGRQVRGRRAVDMLIAAIALAAELPLYTFNPDDFSGLAGVIEVVSLSRPEHAIRLARGVAEETLSIAGRLMLARKEVERMSRVYAVPTTELMSDAETRAILASEGDEEALAALDMIIGRLTELRDQARAEADLTDEE
jgi:predicted nucleic acid-binding protein